MGWRYGGGEAGLVLGWWWEAGLVRGGWAGVGCGCPGGAVCEYLPMASSDHDASIRRAVERPHIAFSDAVDGARVTKGVEQSQRSKRSLTDVSMHGERSAGAVLLLLHTHLPSPPQSPTAHTGASTWVRMCVEA